MLHADDEQAIRDLVRMWLEASQAGNTAAVLDLMTDDIVFTVAGREPFGKEEFAAQSAAMKDIHIDAKSDIQEITVFGDVACLRNHLVMTITPPHGETIRRSGYTLSILRKNAKGAWQFARDANLLTKDEA